MAILEMKHVLIAQNHKHGKLMEKEKAWVNNDDSEPGKTLRSVSVEISSNYRIMTDQNGVYGQYQVVVVAFVTMTLTVETNESRTGRR